MGGADVTPKPLATNVPLIMTGSCQQSIDWLAEHGDAWLTYHRNLNDQQKMVDYWKTAVTGVHKQDEEQPATKPMGEAMGLDLAADPNLPLQQQGFTIRTGRNDLVKFMTAQKKLGLSHVSLGLRSRNRPVQEVIDELGEHVLPHFHG